MLCLFGINLKKQTKTFKIHTQERKSGYLHQHQSKSRCFFFSFFQQWHMEWPAHSFRGKKRKTEMAKEAYQDGRIKTRMITKGERNMLHKIAPLCDSLHLPIP